MFSALRSGLDESKARSFDVICAGEAVWNAVPKSRGSSEVISFRPGAGAVNAALALSRQGLRVGLATVLADDTFGRALRDEIVRANVDIGGVELSVPSSGLFFVEGGARQTVSFREEEQPVAVPESWSSQVLLLSGMSPVVAHGAALCKAARGARRQGSLVVVDINARWHLWKDRDARAIRMILREADVVWCSAEDLFGLNMDVASVRSAMSPTAVLAMTDGMGRAWATGPFGEVVRASEGPPLLGWSGDAFATAICAELARSPSGSTSEALWVRAFQRGHSSASRR
jgi:2-dehydro-3-deoxygluconokinase